MRPLNTNVILKLITTEEKTGGGILYVPDTARKTTNRGEVVGVGPKSTLGLNIGDIVTFDRSKAEPFEVDGVKYVGTEDKHIEAVL